MKFGDLRSSSSGHEVRPINNLFCPHDQFSVAVSFMVVQVVFFFFFLSSSSWLDDNQGILLGV
jgi:hypothetical protein